MGVFGVWLFGLAAVAADFVPVPLEPAGVVDPWRGTASAWKDIARLPRLMAHPLSGEEEARFTYVEHGFARLPVAFVPGEDRWMVSADFDSDGELGAAETIALPVGKLGVLRSSVVRRLPGQESKSVPVELRVSIEGVEDGNPQVAIGNDRWSEGKLPDGTAVAMRSVGGLFDAPRAVVIVDRDGDGKPDRDDPAAAFRVKDGLLAIGEQRYQVRPESDGSGLAVAPTTQDFWRPRVGAIAPSFELLSVDEDKPIGLDQWPGRTVVIEFWATWCGPCKEQQPQLVALAMKHDLAVIGVSADHTLPPLRKYLDRYPLPWKSGWDGGPDGPVARAYGVHGRPEYALVGPDGRLLEFGGLDDVRAALRER